MIARQWNAQSCAPPHRFAQKLVSGMRPLETDGIAIEPQHPYRRPMRREYIAGIGPANRDSVSIEMLMTAGLPSISTHFRKPVAVTVSEGLLGSRP